MNAIEESTNFINNLPWTTSLLWISLGIVALLILLYIYKIIKIVPDEKILIISWFKKEGPTAKILTKGWGIVYWPIQRVREDITVTRKTYNVPSFTLTCLTRKDKDAKTGQIDLSTKEISVYYRLRFEPLFRQVKPAGQYRVRVFKDVTENGKEVKKAFFKREYQTVIKDGKRVKKIVYVTEYCNAEFEPISNVTTAMIMAKVRTYLELAEVQQSNSSDPDKKEPESNSSDSNKKGPKSVSLDPDEVTFLTEALKDIIQELIRKNVAMLGLEKAKLYHTNADSLLTAIQGACDSTERNLPIEITAFSINSPFEIQDKAVADDFNAIGRADIQLRKAEMEIELRRKEAEAQQAAMQVIAASYKIDTLPDHQQHMFWLELRKVEAYKALAESGGSTFVISTEIASSVQKALAKISQGS